MSNNINQFGLYTAKIFDILYDSFPIPTTLTRKEIIAEYLLFDKEKELIELKTKKDFTELFDLIHVDDHELKTQARNALPKINEKLKSIESDQRSDRNKQVAIYEGTLEFLVSEDLIRDSKNGGYQLTSKSFTHLNKTFTDGSIEGVEKSFISALKAVFLKSSSTTVDIAAGTAINVLTKFMGYS